MGYENGSLMHGIHDKETRALFPSCGGSMREDGTHQEPSQLCWHPGLSLPVFRTGRNKCSLFYATARGYSVTVAILKDTAFPRQLFDPGHGQGVLPHGSQVPSLKPGNQAVVGLRKQELSMYFEVSQAGAVRVINYFLGDRTFSP
jgi:hypothetical protein